jgi:hypothetical protein
MEMAIGGSAIGDHGQDLDGLNNVIEAAILRGYPESTFRQQLLAVSQAGIRKLRGYPVTSFLFPLAVAEKVQSESLYARDLCAALMSFYLGIDLLDDLSDGNLNETNEGLIVEVVPLLSHTFYYTLAHDLLIEASKKGYVNQAQLISLLTLFAHGLKTMSEGQCLDLTVKADDQPSLETVEHIVNLKTGARISMIAVSTGIWLQFPENSLEALARYGYHFGAALQFANDLDDIMLQPNSPDILNGTPTMPLVLASQIPAVREMIRYIRTTKDMAKLQQLKQLIIQTGAIQQTIFQIRKQMTGAEESLKQALGSDLPEICKQEFAYLQLFCRQMFHHAIT